MSCARARVATCGVQEEDEGLIGAGGGVAVAAPAPVAAPAAAVDEGSSLLSHDEQQEAFFADPTANGAAQGVVLCLVMHPCCFSLADEAPACMFSCHQYMVMCLLCPAHNEDALQFAVHVSQALCKASTYSDMTFSAESTIML